MAIRRNFKKGTWLAVDDYSGFVTYADQLKPDEYGFYTRHPDVVNQQKYIRSFGDPYPVDPIRPDVEFTAQNYPTLFVGNTSVPVNRQSAGFQALSQVVASAAQPPLDQEIGYSLEVY